MKNILFAFSDPAGANIISSIIKKIEKKDYNFSVLTDNEGFKHPDIIPYLKIINPSNEKLESFVNQFCPEKIFTTASLTSLIEYKLIEISKKQNIPSITFLDHWTDYKKKFFRNERYIFPDKILLIDDKAKSLAISQGLPSDKLHIVGNPFYEGLNNFSPKSNYDEFINFFNLKSERRNILFISDSISEQNGGYQKSIEKYGFNEISVFQSVLQKIIYLSSNSKINFSEYNLLIKLHPKENRKKYDEILSNYRLENIIILESLEFSNHDLIYHSDFHIGMFSSMVLESIIIGKKVLRVEINNIVGDLLNIDKKYFKFITKDSELSEGLLWLLRQNKLLVKPNFKSTIMDYI